MDDFAVMDLFVQLTTAANASPDVINLALERATQEREQEQDIPAVPSGDFDLGPFTIDQ